MSEYQYYEFLALDQPLTEEQRAELRAISTRAEITATRFVNEYQWGDLKGDPRTMVERYFDAFLYLANWGTRRLMFRLPRGVLDSQAAGQYCCTDTASLIETGSHLIETKRPCDYDLAVSLLRDLQALADRQEDSAAFRKRFLQLRAQHQRKPSLLDRFDQAGLPS
jgi:hypothetical protein